LPVSGWAAPILSAPASFLREPAPPRPRPLSCDPPILQRLPLPPADCSFLITDATLVRDLALGRHGVFDLRPPEIRSRRILGIPQPALLGGAGLLLALRGAFHRRPSRDCAPRAA
jgi:hypothetical protein